MFILDASIAVAWCFEDEATPSTVALLNRLRDDEAVVPAIWPLEVANVLLVAERRGRLTEAQTGRFLELLAQLPIEIDEAGIDAAGVLAAGRRQGLSSHDASYLVLAERLGTSLATLDRRLAQAADRAGVQLLIDL